VSYGYQFRLRCDRCQRVSPGIATRTVYTARRHAQDELGWHFNTNTRWVAKYGGKDVCPDCYYAVGDHAPGRAAR
jgi:hypothetical protein